MGLGHFIRCLSIAQSLKSLFDISFVIQSCSPDVIETLKKNNFKLITIHYETDWLNDIDHKTFVLIDVYNFSKTVKNKIKQKCLSLICIDDDYLNYEFADYIINQSPVANFRDYHLINPNNLFLGPSYSLLRRSFIEAAKNCHINKKEENLTICIGGSDPNDYTSQIVSALQAFECPLIINIILGSLTNLIEVEKNINIQSIHKIKIFNNLNEEEMFQILQRSKRVIVPASSILLESICCDCSILTFYYTRNQRKFHDYLVNSNMVNTLGCLPQKNLNPNLFVQLFREFYFSNSEIKTSKLKNQIAISKNRIMQAFDYIMLNSRSV